MQVQLHNSECHRMALNKTHYSSHAPLSCHHLQDFHFHIYNLLGKLEYYDVAIFFMFKKLLMSKSNSKISYNICVPTYHKSHLLQ